MSDDRGARHVTLAHGNGGRFMRELIEQVIAPGLASASLDVTLDAAVLGQTHEVLVATTDGFTVQPLDFPGGNIGSLAIHGTVNDLAVVGAEPRWLTVSFFIEEGLSMDSLARYARSMGAAAAQAGAAIVAGDTKVLPRGQGGGLYLAMTGVGVLSGGLKLGMRHIRPSDAVLVSGSVGDHGVAVLLARQDFGMKGELPSDCASVLPLARALRGLDGVRFMRDPTRGGVATVAHEIVAATGNGLTLNAAQLLVRPPVQAVCEMLGYDPYYLASEGRIVAVVAAEQAEEACRRWRALPEGRDAAIVGAVTAGPPRVVLATELGGQRLLEELEDDPLPRIC